MYKKQKQGTKMGKVISGNFSQAAPPDDPKKKTLKKPSRATTPDKTAKVIRGKFSQAACDDYFCYNTTKRSGKWSRRTKHRDLKKLSLPADVNSVQFFTRQLTGPNADDVKIINKSPVYYIGGKIIENQQYVQTRSGKIRRLTNQTRVVNNNLDLIWSPE